MLRGAANDPQLITSSWQKPPNDPGYVAWHQDSVYWRLDPADVATAWVALTDSSVENGCLRVAARSHREAVPHAARLDRANMLLHGQSAAVDVAEARATDLVLRAGEMSLHHVGILHGSLPNRSAGLRAGLAIRYVAPHVRGAGKASATLVSGVDRYGHYDHEPVPRFDGDPVMVGWHRRAMRRYALRPRGTSSAARTGTRSSAPRGSRSARRPSGSRSTWSAASAADRSRPAVRYFACFAMSRCAAASARYSLASAV
jgi:hypothetical protein